MVEFTLSQNITDHPRNFHFRHTDFCSRTWMGDRMGKQGAMNH